MRTELIETRKAQPGGTGEEEPIVTNAQGDESAGLSDYVTDPPVEPARARRTLPPWLRAGAPTWIWAGVGTVALGFVLIAVAWGQVAAETHVYLQLPYVVSAGLVGLGVIMVGLTVLNVVTRQRDGIDRDRQIDQLITIIDELRQRLAEQQDRQGARR